MDMDFETIKKSILPAVTSDLQNSEHDDLDRVICSRVDQFQKMFQFSDELKNRLINDLRTNFNTTMTLPAILRGKNGYEPWLESKKPELGEWTHWHRYQHYLRTVKGWSENVIQSLDETSDEILDLLADPSIKGRSFDRRGLVVGYVQSGKTASFTSVINKAFDAGFKVVIVLAGMHNNLRSQTQIRLDEEVIGFTMQRKNIKNRFVGVGKVLGYKQTDTISLTNREPDGDFHEKKAGAMFNPPILLVVKKNQTVLTNLLTYLKEKSKFSRWSEDGSKKIVPDLPLLIIDDEADQATVNTSEIYDDDDNLIEDYNPTAINGLIRAIFETFEQRAYVGYTATPFANVLIDQHSKTDGHGYDLFPRDFILSLPKPSNYVGPTEYFNLEDDADNQQAGLVRLLDEEENGTFMPLRHKKHHVPHFLPKNLNEAIYAFVIATAIRRLRGQVKQHSSMLVHVTRFTDVQAHTFNLIDQRVTEMKEAIRHGSKTTEEYFCMQELYETDFVQTSAQRQDGGETFRWDDVLEAIQAVLDKLQVKQINGKSEDVLDYAHSEDSMYVIAVGGDKLSRGLTLEGLTVSYYMRISKMYDTLMQMGRWFGYRDGYVDLCRIYTTEEQANWFYHVAIATEELRAQIVEMSERNLTPEQYVLQIETHPDMQITSPNKMRAAQTIKVSYSASLIQTTVFENNKLFFADNFRTTEKFVQRLGGMSTARTASDTMTTSGQPTVASKKGYYYWENVSVEDILFFLDNYKTPNFLSRVDTPSIKAYIQNQKLHGGLTSWTVILVDMGSKSNRILQDLELATGVKRKGEEKTYSKTVNAFSIRILTSEGHEFLDYPSDVYEEVEQMREEDKQKTNGKKGKSSIFLRARAKRDKTKGLLLLYPLDTEHGVVKMAADALGLTDKEIPIGFAISFPKAQASSNETYYIVNKSV